MHVFIFSRGVSMNLFSFKYRNVILGVTATAVGYYAVLTPHTIFLKQCRAIMTRYQLGKEVPIDLKTQQKIQKIMDDLRLPDDVRHAIKPFSVFGLDLLHFGTLNAKYGALLGIPANFTNTIEYLRENFAVKDESIDWTRQDARIFLKALMLSEDAQKFAIAREILRIQAEEPYFNSLGLALIIATMLTLYSIVSYIFGLRKRNAILRRTFYVVFISFGAILWLGVKDYRSCQLDKENDEALCRLGPDYIKGGQEFYEKTLLRNKVLRTLLGEEGKTIYTVYGNKEYFLRQKHIPISHRKDFFDSRLRDLEKIN